MMTGAFGVLSQMFPVDPLTLYYSTVILGTVRLEGVVVFAIYAWFWNNRQTAKLRVVFSIHRWF